MGTRSGTGVMWPQVFNLRYPALWTAPLGTAAAKAAERLLSGRVVDEAWGHLNEEVASHFLDRYGDLLRG